MSEAMYSDQTVQQNSKIGLTKAVYSYNLALTGVGQELKFR